MLEPRYADVSAATAAYSTFQEVGVPVPTVMLARSVPAFAKPSPSLTSRMRESAT